jgi:hypothetical protein
VSETQLSASIRGALEATGVWVIRMGVNMKRGKRGTQSGEPGMPDLLCPAYGWLETKVDEGKLSPGQRIWHDKAARNGVRVAVVRSVHEALMQVSLWKLAPRAKHLTRIK